MSPERPGPFSYLDLIIEALRLKEICELGLPLGKRLYSFLTSQRVTALAGFAILSAPLFPCLDLGLEMGRCGKLEVERSTEEDAYWYLRGLKESRLSHLKRVEGEFPDVERPEEVFERGWTLKDVLKMSKDSISQEILEGYPVSTKGAELLLKDGFDKVREVQRLALSERIDDLVARKRGYKVAYTLTILAREGLHDLFIEEMGLNPGTAADIVGVSILIALSEAFKRGMLW